MSSIISLITCCHCQPTFIRVSVQPTLDLGQVVRQFARVQKGTRCMTSVNLAITALMSLDLKRSNSIILTGPKTPSQHLAIRRTTLSTHQLLNHILALIVHDRVSIPIRIVCSNKRHVAITPLTKLSVSVACRWCLTGSQQWTRSRCCW